jgi:hypothetical protein
MKIYNYNKDFIFTIESEAYLDLLETKLQQKDIFLIPAQATIIQPPIYNNEKEFIKFVNNTWQIIQKPDLTKKVYYNVDNVIFEFENITLVDQYILDNYQPATEQQITVYLFEKAKQTKLTELENYYKNSSDLRNLLINNKFNISTKSDGRQLVDEQVRHINHKIQLGETTQDTAYFDYYDNGAFVRISYNQLLNLSVKILDITNQNFVIYDKHKANINDLQSISNVENYDIKKNFLINNTITL